MTKLQFLVNLSNKRIGKKPTSDIAKEIREQKTGIDLMRCYFYYYPQASFNAFWLEYGNMLHLTKKQAKVLIR